MTVASVLYKGDYADITEAYAAAFSFVEEQKLNVVGNFFNIYHVSPADTDNAAEYVTEICIPVER